MGWKAPDGLTFTLSGTEDKDDEITTAALIHGAGTASVPYDMSTSANKNCLGYWAKSTATSGDSRLAYLRLYFEGTGVSGEALRVFGTVNNKTVATGGTVNGAHISLSVSGASGAISGAGNALRVTLGYGAATNPGGTCSALQIDSDFASNATLQSKLCAVRLTNSGTGVWPYFMEIPNASNGTIFAVHTTQTLTHSIRIKSANGTDYYIMCTNAATNRS